MNLTIDEALAELRRIAAALDALPPEHPDRTALEMRRALLRTAAREAADLSRDPLALRRELEVLENRLKDFERRTIKRSLMEHHKWINDPSAYSSAINDRIEADTARDRATVATRIEELRTRIAELEGRESEAGAGD